jgi:hypothetical protein
MNVKGNVVKRTERGIWYCCAVDIKSGRNVDGKVDANIIMIRYG